MNQKLRNFGGHSSDLSLGRTALLVGNKKIKSGGLSYSGMSYSQGYTIICQDCIYFDLNDQSMEAMKGLLQM